MKVCRFSYETLSLHRSRYRGGFPANCDNVNVPLPRKCSEQGFDSLIKAREALPQPISPYSQKQIQMARGYLLQGAPYGLNESELALVHGKHNFSDARDQALCLDSLASFAAQGFLVGPLPLSAVNAPKLVGAFTREQESSQKRRCISDLSQPRGKIGEDGKRQKAGSFNDAMSLQPVHDWPMVDPGTVQAVVALILDNGKAIFTKIDVSNAYKVLWET